VRELDEGQLGAAGGGVQAEQGGGELVGGAQVRAVLGGPVAGRGPGQDAQGREVAQQQVERDR
jgi:hypothetical protein